MDLRDYVRVLRKGWALILAVTVVGIALGVGLTLATTKVYQANTEVFVSSNVVPSSQQIQGGGTFVAQRVESYPNLATAPEVLGATLKDPSVVDQLNGTQLSSAGLAKKITADVTSGTVIVNLHVRDTNAVTATVLANTLTDKFNFYVANKFEQRIPVVSADGTVSKFSPAVTLTTSQPAVVPSSPVKPNKVLNIGLGFILGLVVGVGVAVLREILDNTVKSGKDFEALGIPLLAQVAFDKRAAKSPIAFRADAHSARSESYRQLRTNLQFVDVDNPPRIIAVTSAIPGEGKSTTAINLAAALAEAGSRVCLIEADLRRPSIAKALGLVSDVGFTTAVIGKAPVESVLQNAGRNLAVLTCGPIPPNPSELLLSKHAKQVIYDIAAKVDYTIIDTPPLLPVTDGAEIATIADATILVHRAARTTRDQAARSLQALEKVGERPVGVILNMVTRGGGGRYDYEYGYYYAAYRPNAADPQATPAQPAAQGTDDETITLTPATRRRKPARPAPGPADDAGERAGGRRARHRDAAAAAAADHAGFTPVAPAPAVAFAPEVVDAGPADAAATEVTDTEVVETDGLPDEDPYRPGANGAPYDRDPDGEYDDFYDEAEDATETFAAVSRDVDPPSNGDGHVNGRPPASRGGRLGGRRFQR